METLEMLKTIIEVVCLFSVMIGAVMMSKSWKSSSIDYVEVDSMFNERASRGTSEAKLSYDVRACVILTNKYDVRTARRAIEYYGWKVEGGKG